MRSIKRLSFLAFLALAGCLVQRDTPPVEAPIAGPSAIVSAAWNTMEDEVAVRVGWRFPDMKQLRIQPVSVAQEGLGVRSMTLAGFDGKPSSCVVSTPLGEQVVVPPAAIRLVIGAENRNLCDPGTGNRNDDQIDVVLGARIVDIGDGPQYLIGYSVDEVFVADDFSGSKAYIAFHRFPELQRARP